MIDDGAGQMQVWLHEGDFSVAGFYATTVPQVGDLITISDPDGSKGYPMYEVIGRTWNVGLNSDRLTGVGVEVRRIIRKTRRTKARSK